MDRKVDAGFEEGESDNLPGVHYGMITNFLVANALHIGSSAEKVRRFAREEYLDEAIGYVQVKRDAALCTVKGLVTSEHDSPIKDYAVEFQIDIEEKVIQQCVCHDCFGGPGCEHCITFLFWLYEKSKVPERAPVQCFWRPSYLSLISTGQKYFLLSDLLKKTPAADPLPPHNGEFANLVMSVGNQREATCLFLETRPESKPQQLLSSCISLHHLAIKFRTENNMSLEAFKMFCEKEITNEMCDEVEDLTRGKYEYPLWHECRYGRIAASRFYDVSQCESPDCSLVEIILGAGLPVAMDELINKKQLKLQVLQTVANAKAIPIKQSGTFLRSNLPFFVASPDGISVSGACIFEVKLLEKKKNISQYVEDNGQLKERLFAKVQLQMHMAQVQKGVYCIAADSEQTVHMVEVDYNAKYVNNLISKCLMFYEWAIFPKIVMP